MVLGEAVAGAAASAYSLWGYNRGNYLFDREMRQKQEFKVLGYRNRQAELWREDIRDIVGLTERKMDSYLIVNTLQLGMCVGLFTEGRLEPGTPPWLLHLYMLTLGAAFMYLLMSVWLAMHASVVAQCSSVRLLTQFARLPVPTWQQLEDMRTYGSSYENVQVHHAMRVPFLNSAKLTRSTDVDGRPSVAMAHGHHEHHDHHKRNAHHSSHPFSSRGTGDQDTSGVQAGPAASSSHAATEEQTGTVDPWELEEHGEARQLYELEAMPLHMRHHIHLAKKASAHYMCFDAFARVAMTLGTNQLLNAIAYYCLGYVSVQDGAPWAACTVVTIALAIAVALIELDLSLTRKEQAIAKLLILCGPICGSVATTRWTFGGQEANAFVLGVLPLCYASHGLWLLWVLGACDVEPQPCGTMLPMKFKAVLYVDVFGWLHKKNSKDGGQSAGYTPMTEGGTEIQPDQDSMSPRSQMRLQRELHKDIAVWKSEQVQHMMEEREKARVEQLNDKFQAAIAAQGGAEGLLSPSPSCASLMPSASTMPDGQWLKLRGYTDYGTEVPYLYHPETGEVLLLPEGQSTPAQMPAPSGDEGTQTSEGRFAFPTNRLEVRTITFAEEEVDRLSKAVTARGEQAVPRIRVHSDAEAVSDHLEGIGCFYPDKCAAKYWNLPCNNVQVAPKEEGISVADPPSVSFQGSKESPLFAQKSHTPSGVISHAPDHAFHPQSFITGGKNGEEESTDEEIVTGHDTHTPGQVPWRVFRGATRVLVALWAAGAAMPLTVLRSSETTPLTTSILFGTFGNNSEHGGGEVRAVGTDPDGLPRLVVLPTVTGDMRRNLVGGEVMPVVWPHAGFIPSALSSDPSGTTLLVADDLGVYSANLKRKAAGSIDDDGVQVRELKNINTGGIVQQSDETPKFLRMPRCGALEGQALKDVGVLCEGGSPEVCHALVLHAHGHRLAMCPLSPQRAGSPKSLVNTFMKKPDPMKLQSHNGTPSVIWGISTGWLHNNMEEEQSDEYVESVAVNNECVKADTEDSNGEEIDLRANKVGCFVVGTSEGRIVQLRRHVSDREMLVPERAVQQRLGSVGRGSLHVFHHGCILALQPGTSSLQAFDEDLHNVIGEWRLNEEIHWLTLCGGGDSLYVLGVKDTVAQLYRFPIPVELQETVRRLRQDKESKLVGGRASEV